MADTKHVVLIHGTWLNGDSWADTRAEFEQRGYTVHTPTLRFHDLPFEEGAKNLGRSACATTRTILSRSSKLSTLRR